MCAGTQQFKFSMRKRQDRVALIGIDGFMFQVQTLFGLEREGQPKSKEQGKN